MMGVEFKLPRALVTDLQMRGALRRVSGRVSLAVGGASAATGLYARDFQAPLTRRIFDWDEPVSRRKPTAKFIDRYAIEAPPLEKGAI